MVFHIYCVYCTFSVDSTKATSKLSLHKGLELAWSVVLESIDLVHSAMPDTGKELRLRIRELFT